MSIIDDLKKLAGVKPTAEHALAREHAATIKETEKRIDRLKAKARRSIDIAYNRALSEALLAVGDELTREAKDRVLALRREVRAA